MSHICKVRGGLGTQLMSLCTDYAEYGTHVTKILYCLQGYLPEHQKVMKTEVIGRKYLENILNFHSDITFIGDGGGKTSLALERLEHMLLFREDVLSLASIKEAKGFSDNILHVRKWDSDLLNDDDYKYLIDKYNCQHIITDNPEYCKTFGLKMSEDPENETLDWLRLANSSVTCTGPYSTFTLMAAFYNPNLDLKVLVKDEQYDEKIWGGNQKAQSNDRVVELFVKYLDNVSYVW